MAAPIRTFVAADFEIPGKVRALVDELDTLGRAVRATPPENLHVTLKFLGDVDPEVVSLVAQTTNDAAQGMPPVDARLVGLGAFPTTFRPSVVWIGLADAQPLVDLAARLETALEDLGFPRENRGFHPHLTLARVKFRPPPRLGELFEEHATTQFGPARIERVVLYQSEPGPGGSRYTPLATVDLEGGE